MKLIPERADVERVCQFARSVGATWINANSPAPVVQANISPSTGDQYLFRRMVEQTFPTAIIAVEGNIITVDLQRVAKP